MATREKFVPACVAVTFADPIAAPEGSTTLPTMLPRPWAKDGIADSQRTKRRIMKLRLMPGLLLGLESGAALEMRRTYPDSAPGPFALKTREESSFPSYLN